MRHAKVLLLHEPTSALDLAVEATIRNLLKRLCAAHKLTTRLVSHELPVVAHMCERPAAVSRGAIVREMGVAALRGTDPRAACTRQMLPARSGYGRKSAAGLVTQDRAASRSSARDSAPSGAVSPSRIEKWFSSGSSAWSVGSPAPAGAAA